MRWREAAGFSLVELLISLTVVVIVAGGLTGFVIQNARINKSQQMAAEVQTNARNCLEMIVQQLRSAGWDPMNSGAIPTVALDPDLIDGISQIEVFADLDEDSLTTSPNEQVLIRHTSDQIEWRRSPADPFTILATHITNDADGDSTIEPMFVPDADPPTRITVQITARSPVPDPVTGDFIRYTVRSDVLLRKAV
jgi:prepilin-type N-terminal cleavage/methylation domain-containing protein